LVKLLYYVVVDRWWYCWTCCWHCVFYSETNLKLRQALPCTADMTEIEQLSRFDGW